MIPSLPEKLAMEQWNGLTQVIYIKVCLLLVLGCSTLHFRVCPPPNIAKMSRWEHCADRRPMNIQFKECPHHIEYRDKKLGCGWQALLPSLLRSHLRNWEAAIPTPILRKRKFLLRHERAAGEWMCTGPVWCLCDGFKELKGLTGNLWWCYNRVLWILLQHLATNSFCCIFLFVCLLEWVCGNVVAMDQVWLSHRFKKSKDNFLVQYIIKQSDFYRHKIKDCLQIREWSRHIFGPMGILVGWDNGENKNFWIWLANSYGPN